MMTSAICVYALATAPACAKSVVVPPTPVRNCGVPVVSVRFVTFVTLKPDTETPLGDAITTEAGAPNTSSGP